MRTLFASLFLFSIPMQLSGCGWFDDSSSRTERDDDDDDSEKSIVVLERDIDIESENCTALDESGQRRDVRLDVERVTIDEDETVVYFELDQAFGEYRLESPGAAFAFRITDIGARIGGVYPLRDVKGVDLTEAPLNTTNGDRRFRLIFDPLPASVEEIYITEGETWDNAVNRGTWRCDNVILTTESD